MESGQTTNPSHVPPVLGRLWWRPLAFVALSLAVLLVVPLVINQRVNKLRGALDANDHARVYLNDLESAAATEALVGTARRAGHVPNARDDSILAAAAKHAQDDEEALDSLFASAEPQIRRQIDTLGAIERAWRPNALRTDGIMPDPIVMFTIAEHLDDRLAQAQQDGRDKSRKAQHITLLLLVALIPCALVSLGVVYWGGKRYVRVAHSLEVERAALARSLETRAALLRGITHDVKNPLGAAAGYADLLADGMSGGAPLPPQQATMVRRIRKLIGEALDTIGEMLQLERGQAWVDGDSATKPVDVAAIVSDLVEDYRAAGNEKSLTITLEATNTSVVVASGATHVQHIIGNLLSNAVKYTPDHGAIRVRVARRSDHGHPDTVVVEVSDSGAGVPPELRERVFEEFYRADSARSASGHGVGLAISRRLARLLGGDITVGVSAEGGAKFTLLLPALARASAA